MYVRHMALRPPGAPAELFGVGEGKQMDGCWRTGPSLMFLWVVDGGGVGGGVGVKGGTEVEEYRSVTDVHLFGSWLTDSEWNTHQDHLVSTATEREMREGEREF